MKRFLAFHSTQKGAGEWGSVRGCLAAWALVVASVAVQAENKTFDHSHSLYGEVLRRFVKNDRVDYAALNATPEKLNAYLDSLATVGKNEFAEWTKREQLCYLINLYNAQTLRLIIDHYPLESIKAIGTILKGPWDQPVVRLFGNTVTLNHLEHKILRKDYDEPRIHFALVCAARGCPPLRPEPFVPNRLEAQLDEQGRLFMSDPEKNQVDLDRRVLRLSPIFDWFEEDFVKAAGSVQTFVSRYFPPEKGRYLLESNYKIQYSDYDWRLNDVGR